MAQLPLLDLPGLGQGISPSNAGLVTATGVSSRVIAYPAAGLLLLATLVALGAH